MGMLYFLLDFICNWLFCNQKAWKNVNFFYNVQKYTKKRGRTEEDSRKKKKKQNPLDFESNIDWGESQLFTCSG